VIVNGDVPVFRNVMVCWLLVTPVVWLGKVSDVSISNAEIDEVIPKPARSTVCVPALSVRVTVPVRAPATVGVKLTWKLQLALAVRVAVQLLLEMAKSPVWAKLRLVTDEAEVFVTVTNWAPLVVLMT